MNRDSHAARHGTAELRFYEELNDFLPPDRRKRSFLHGFTGEPSVEDTLDALGVPRALVDLVLVDGRSVGFDHRLHGGERVAVYPMFERVDISPLLRVRRRPLRTTRFVLDADLGALARRLRARGFDAVWRDDFDGAAIVDVSIRERRIVLTRDDALLRDPRLTHAYRLRSTEPREQLEEVVRALDLGRRRSSLAVPTE
ncbi:MAG TPA: Mut7-C RNAse domain-containing protein [Gammaproteobacteria bacterium]|nr:Mut7-C RNAse domain-containing protein [Gammaproteobacteria bacterium]